MTIEIEEGRKPIQARSKQRVCLILETAATMIIQFGVDNLTMNQLAHNAELPVGSVYQYFPSKRALLKTLLENHLEHINNVILNLLNEITDEQSLIGGLRRAISTLFEIGYQDNLGYELWVGTQFDPALRQMHDNDGQRYIATFANKIAQVQKQDVTPELLTKCNIYIVSLDACLRSVIDADEKKQHTIINEFGNLILRELKLNT